MQVCELCDSEKNVKSIDGYYPFHFCCDMGVTSLPDLCDECEKYMDEEMNKRGIGTEVEEYDDDELL